MSKYLYFATTQGDLVDNEQIVRAAKITEGISISSEDFEEVRRFAQSCKGIKKEVNPSLKRLIKDGRKYYAILVYHRNHPEMSFHDCINAVNEIEAKLSATRH